MTQLFRIAIRVKESDKRKSATVFRFVVMATTLDEAKELAVARWVDPPDYDYRTHTLEQIAAVTGHAMETLAYNADIYGDRDHSEQPDTIPTREAVDAARGVLDAHAKACE